MTLPSDIVALSIAETWSRRDVLIGGLTQLERTELDALGTDKRKSERLAGRLAAKRAVQRTTGLAFGRIEIRTSVEPETKGRPSIWIDGAPVEDAWVSITHCRDLALATVAPRPVGVDLEVIAPRSAGFESLVFADSERRFLTRVPAEQRATASTELWCLKEAYAKVLGVGFNAAFHDVVLPAGLNVETGLVTDGEVELCWARVRAVPAMERVA